MFIGSIINIIMNTDDQIRFANNIFLNLKTLQTNIFSYSDFFY